MQNQPNNIIPQGQGPESLKEQSEQNGVDRGEILQPNVSPEKTPQSPEPAPKVEETAQPSNSSTDAIANAPSGAEGSGDNLEATAISDENIIEETGIDKQFEKAGKEVIDKYKDKPYEEEEEHENLQIRYLWTRFKKKLKKSK